MNIKPIMCGLDYLRDKRWQPIKRTPKGALILATGCLKQSKEGGWTLSIIDCGAYYRINVSRNH